MKPATGFIAMLALLFSCETKMKNNEEAKIVVPIEGTWELISGTIITKSDTVFTDYTKDQKMIKIINATHFSFLKHDMNNGKDSAAAVYESGGGSYSLVDDQYTERLDYCNAREWEGHEFNFSVTVVNDTLIQKGIEKLENLGIDRVIIEKYKRIKD